MHNDVVLQLQQVTPLHGIFWSKHDICITQKNVFDKKYIWCESYEFPLGLDAGTFRISNSRDEHWATMYVPTHIPRLNRMNLGYLYP